MAKSRLLSDEEKKSLGIGLSKDTNKAIKAQAKLTASIVREEIEKYLSGLIIGVDGCTFEERLDGDKGCIVLDMNENQWREFWQSIKGGNDEPRS